MAAKLVLLVSCLALASAMVRRDAPSLLDELEKHAQEFQKTFSEQFKAFSESKDREASTKALQDGSDAVLKQLSTFSASLQRALSDANGKAKEAVEQTRASLERAADELRRAHPDVERQAAQLKAQLEQAVQTTVQESQKLAKELGSNLEATNKKLAPKIKEAYDDFVKQTQDVQKKLHESANKQ